VIVRLQQMMEMQGWRLAEPELVAEMLHRMHVEIEQPDPSPEFLRSVIARLYVKLPDILGRVCRQQIRQNCSKFRS
jgi:hypothetical protein